MTGIETLPVSASLVHGLFDVALDTRLMLERAWSAETAYQGITLQPEDPPSRGQCGVSAVWLSRYLMRHDVEAYFTEGIIDLDGLHDEHVWVEVRSSGQPHQVIDVTSDQHRTRNGSRVHVGEYNSGPGTIGMYEPLQHFVPDAIPRRKLMARFAILEANIAQLPRRKRMK